MASSKKIKVRPQHTTLFINLRLLMSCNNHSDALKTLLTEDVFVLPNSNKKASNEVIYFILNVWSKEKCAEKFKFCWPVLDRKQESQFQRAACTLLQEIKSAHPDANLPTVSLALLLQPGGDKYCNFLLRLTMFLLAHSMKVGDLKARPNVKSEESLRSLIEETKRDVSCLLLSAAQSHANAVATFSQAEEFSRKLKEWWHSWEECEESALLEFRKEASLLDVPDDFKEKMLENPSNFKDFELVVIDLRNEVEKILSLLEGSQHQTYQRASSASPEGKPSFVKKTLNLERLALVRQKLLKGLSELTLLLDEGKRQPSWLIHSEVASLELAMQEGQTADFMDQMEDKLRSAKRSGTRIERRKSFAPSNVFNFSPCILRQVPPTPSFDINHLTANGVDCSPFWMRYQSLPDEKESLESLLSRWNCYDHEQPVLAEENLSQAAIPSGSQIVPAIKAESATPIEKFRPKEHNTPLNPLQLDRNSLILTPSNGSEMAIQMEKSFHDISGEELPLGDVSLLELAEMHLTFDSASVSPEPLQVQKVLSPPPAAEPEEPVDVKPDLSSLLKRLQAIKAKSKTLPSVLVKSELVSL
ncbi:uncharacterized protein LOC135936851 [Cloeon dipterum]|uniref:uncharacterized protein LOC135936851 n=1 Tax=Cloeon dipterum TaxID=197152 RepID=UPI0032205CB2